MKTLVLGAAAINTTPKDWVGNSEKILGVLAEAKTRNVDFVCLPELCVSGYGCEDEFHAPYVAETALKILLRDIVPAVQGFGAAVGLPLNYGGSVYNVIAVISEGQLLGFTAKQNLAGDGIHYEPRFFKRWPARQIVQTTTSIGSVPLGDLMYNLGGIRFALEICEDAWVAGRPGISHSRHGVDVILNPSASHFAFGKTLTRERFVLEGARAFNCAYVYANLLGNEAGRAIYDGDCFIANAGGIRAASQRFSYDAWTLTIASVDIETSRVARSRLASYEPDFCDNGMVDRAAGWAAREIRPMPCRAMTRVVQSKNEEFAHAVALGLYDYLRKTRCRGYALSLSGGTDSAACAVLVALMVRFSHGSARSYLERLTKLPSGAAERTLLERLLSCAYQASSNSGEVTHNAAQAVAKDIGARFVSFDIAGLVTKYEELLAEYLRRPLEWERDDITRQNIQARVRNPSIWAIANAENFLLLTTSNRSEATVGYCTMDGDTAGSLAPLAGIDKNFLREWLVWARTEFDLPSLDLVNRQVPTAELKPATFKQTDEADLGGSYEMINRIQKLLVVEKKSPRDIFTILASADEYGDDLSREQIFAAISKILSLWSRNQWKRERYAPSFHLDDENLDPRTWCRYPILSGNYSYELSELQHELFGKNAS